MTVLSNLALPPRRIKKEIGRALAQGLVPFVRSSPGMGKSDIIRSIAERAGLKVMDFRLGQADITDLNGLPEFFTDSNDKRRSRYVPFEDFPLEGDELPINPKTGMPYNGWLLFFDELTSAPKQLQGAAFKILLEKKVGQSMLHEKVWMAAAGNLETDNAVVHAINTALQSRLIHLELAVDLRDWIDWAIQNDVDKRMMAFIEFDPNMLHMFVPSHTDRTFPCPRTWWFANLLTKDQPLTLNNDLAILAGTIGPAAAQKYIQFTQVFETLPSLADILKNPGGIPIPAEPSTRYAIAVMLSDQINDKNADDLLTFLRRLPVEARLLSLRMAAARDASLIRHPALRDVMKDLVRI